MNDNHFKLVNYSEKSVALLIEKDGVLTEELTEIGGRYNWRLTCGPGWIFSRKKALEALTALLDYYEIIYKTYELTELPTVTKPAPKNNSLPAFILSDDERKNWCIEHNHNEWFCKQFPLMIKLSGGEHVAIESLELKTEFWHRDEGPDYEHHLEITSSEQSMSEYFLSENLKNLQDYIDALKDVGKNLFKQYVWKKNYTNDINNFWCVEFSRINPESVNAIEFFDEYHQDLYKKGFFRKLTDDDRQRLIAGFEYAIEKRKKRCMAWLKRYGVSKLRFNTYWADR